MEQEFTQIGTREAWGKDMPFGIFREDRRQHLYTVGRTGTGKSTMLLNMITQDIEAGLGVGVIDPHGTLAAEVLARIPAHRIEDTVLFNPSDSEYPVGLNVLTSVSPDGRSLAASGIVSVFRSIWRDSWGARMEYILYAAVAALLECENVSLLGVSRMLSDERYRSWVVQQVCDPMVRSFWINECSNYRGGFAQEAVSPIQNKVGQMLMSPLLRNVLGQVKSRVDARFMMDRGRIFVADLSKGKLGSDKTSLLGALLVTKFQLAAMARADIAEEDRKDFMLYVDEFQSFSTDSFVSILSEARKYRLCLTLSHQYIDQVPREIRDAVFGNVGSLVSFRVGERDAEILEREFGSSLSRSQLAGLGNYEVCAKILAHGEYGEPFIGRTMPPLGAKHGHSAKILARSREKYSRHRGEVERKIERWLN